MTLKDRAPQTQGQPREARIRMTNVWVMTSYTKTSILICFVGAYRVCLRQALIITVPYLPSQKYWRFEPHKLKLSRTTSMGCQLVNVRRNTSWSSVRAHSVMLGSRILQVWPTLSCRLRLCFCSDSCCAIVQSLTTASMFGTVGKSQISSYYCQYIAMPKGSQSGSIRSVNGTVHMVFRVSGEHIRCPVMTGIQYVCNRRWWTIMLSRSRRSLVRPLDFSPSYLFFRTVFIQLHCSSRKCRFPPTQSRSNTLTKPRFISACEDILHLILIERNQNTLYSIF